jgi:hypothetical protein
MSFTVSKNFIENYKTVQGLVSPANLQANSACEINLGLSTSYSVSLCQLSSASNIYITGPNAPITLTLPSNSELSKLFTNPVKGSLTDWYIFPNTSGPGVNNITITLTNPSGAESVTLAGASMYKLAMQVSDDPIAFDLHWIAYNNSVVMPVPFVQTVTNASTMLQWQYLNAGTAYPPSLLLSGSLSGPLSLALDNGLNLWNKLFGSSSMPSAGSVYYGDIVIINNTNNTVTLSSTVSNPSGVISIIGGPVAVATKACVQLKVKFSAKTTSSATAQVIANVLAFTV